MRNPKFMQKENADLINMFMAASLEVKENFNKGTPMPIV